MFIERRLQLLRLCEVGGSGIAVELWWNDTDRGNGVLGGKLVLVPLRPPKISHGLTRDRSRAYAVTGRRLK